MVYFWLQNITKLLNKYSKYVGGYRNIRREPTQTPEMHSSSSNPLPITNVFNKTTLSEDLLYMDCCVLLYMCRYVYIAVLLPILAVKSFRF